MRERVSYFESVTARGAGPPLPPPAVALARAPSLAAKLRLPDQAPPPPALHGGTLVADEEEDTQQVHA